MTVAELIAALQGEGINPEWPVMLESDEGDDCHRERH